MTNKPIPAMFNGNRADRTWYLKYSKDCKDWELVNMFTRWRELRKLAIAGRIKGASRNQKIGTRLDG